ncbi:outer membrane lipoprotein-sorting protein [Acidobacteriota bacterium]
METTRASKLRILLVIMTSLSMILLCTFVLFAQEEDVAADDEQVMITIVKEVDKIIGMQDMRAKETMTIHRKDGSVRDYKLIVLTRGTEDAFAQISDPPREKGRQMLKLGSPVWSYLPSVKKSIRVSGRSSFMGGDFENNDVLKLNLVEDYKPISLERLEDQYVLALKGHDLSLTYAKIKLWVSKDTFQPTKQEYYTINDKLIKSSVYSDIKKFGDFERPAVVEMVSATAKTKTILELIEFEKNVKNPDSLFRRSNLGKWFDYK